MSKTKLQAMVEELVSLRELAVELADEIDTLQDVIKADMQRQGVDTIEAGKHTVRWAVVKSSRFDSKAFSAAHPALYSEYAKRRREETRYTITPDGLDYPEGMEVQNRG